MKGDLVIPKLKIDSSVLFEAGAATLQGQVVREELLKIVDFVRSFSPSKLVIEGHTDSDGDEAANQDLSVRRAEMVRDYLISNYTEITPEMVSAQGYGESRPLVRNDTPENRALNRRIEIVVWE
ncbi:OmpA family protein [Candidatus Latescibacterota bacterium]